MDIQAGEIYGKQSGTRFVMYQVLKIGKSGITLQNIDNPLSLFETSPEKLQLSGYRLVSQTPYIAPSKTTGKKKRQAVKKPLRCPYTLDFLADRADHERPAPIIQDLFS